MLRWLAIAVWAYAAWVLLTWTLTAEQLLFGAGVAALAATALWPLGDVAHPWRVLEPRRAWLLLRIGALIGAGLVKANISLSRRIWSPSRPLRPGMVVVRTEAESDGELTAVGLLTSIVVDNQIVDVDRRRKQLQYHAVWIDSRDPEDNRYHINGPLEALLEAMRR